jgi:hypothetical protein
MDQTLIPIWTALSLGFLHALEVDHMIAVTTFVAGRPAAPQAARFGLRWGLGHSLAVLVFGGVLLLTGLRWPSRYDAVGEGVVGVMLLGLGLWAIRSSRKLHLHIPPEHGDHAHLHIHGDPPVNGRAGTEGAPVHVHPHDHHHGHRHAHGHGITVVGLLHGLAGTSAVVALVPVTFIHRLDVGLAYLAAFGVGVTSGMTIYAVVAALAMRQAVGRSVLWGQRLAGLVGVLGVLVGIWWIRNAVFG